MKHGLKRVCFAASIGAAPAMAGAAGFALLEQNVSGLGNAYAGTAAIAGDASTIFFNPAGMTLLPGMQVVVSAAGINVQSEFSGNGSLTPSPPITVSPGTNDGGDAGGFAFLPALYFSAPIGDRWAVGIGVGAPFGLKTEYDDDWVGRFLGIKSELTTVNVNPSVAFKVNENISLGAGVNWQRADATLTQAALLGTGLEGDTDLEADGDAWGWNVGAMFKLGTDMRIGISYRSSLDFTLDGNVKTTTPTGLTVPQGTFPAKADIKFPDSALLSIVQQYGDKWQLLGDLQYTHWSTIGTVHIVNTNNGRTMDEVVLNFEDAWRIALGINYLHGQKWTFRGGIAWDQSPVDDNNRTVRLPDNDRFWLALGAQFKFGKGGALDFGYAHLFISSPDINQSKSAVLGGVLPYTVRVNGDYDNSTDIFGIQLTWTF